MTTETKDLKDAIDNQNGNDHEEKDPYKMALDSSLPVEVSVRAFEVYYGEFHHYAMELLTKLTGMYIFSGVKSLEKRLAMIVFDSTLPAMYKMEAAKSLCLRNSDDEDIGVQDIGYNALNAVCESFFDERGASIPTPVKVDAIYLLMASKTYRDNVLEYFVRITNNQDLDCEYRYKLILTLETRVKESAWYLERSCVAFLTNASNWTMHRILASQYLLSNFKDSPNDQVMEILLSFAHDADLDYNLRADAADVVLKFGSPDNKMIARDIIMVLGSQDRHGTVTIYQNAQNVHNEKIEETIIEIIEFLSTVVVPEHMTFDTVADDLERFVQEDGKPPSDSLRESLVASRPGRRLEEEPNMVKISLNRIHMDRALYSKFNYSLRHILVRVYVTIENTENEDEKKVLRTRLYQELTEMAGTCSTGFAGRLCNVLSGFHGINMKISWEDQIIANFGARMNTRIHNITQFLDAKQKHDLLIIYCGESEQPIPADEKEEEAMIPIAIDEFKANITMEMTLDPSCYEERSHYLKFIQMMFSQIREELKDEFVAYITETDFDLYFRKAIAHYEGQIVK